MKNRTGHIIILILTILFLSSCSKEDLVIMPEYETSKVSLQLSVSEKIADGQNSVSNTEVLSKSSSATSMQTNVIRGNAPMHVDGVRMSVTHQTLKNANGSPLMKFKDFYFSGDTDSGVAASMDVVIGDNNFSVESFTSAEAVNKVHKDEINLFDEDDFEWDYYYENGRWPNNIQITNGKVNHYSQELAEIHPVYSHYSGITSALVTKDDYSVNVPMTTDNARFSVVLEAPSKYRLTLYLYDFSIGDWMEVSKDRNENKSKVLSIVFNNENMNGVKDMPIYLVVERKQNRNKYKVVYDDFIYDSNGRYFQSEPGKNKTIVLDYK